MNLLFKSISKLIGSSQVFTPLIAGVFLVACTPDEKSNSHFIVPEGFTVESVVAQDLISYPIFASFDLQGRLFVAESTEPNEMDTEEMLGEPSYHIRLLTDTDLDGNFDQSTVFADKIPFPMGGTFYNGSLYVVASPDLLKFTDTNNDGIADQREVVLTGWTLNVNGAILSGPYMGPDGRFYLAGARRGFDITSKEGIHFQGKGARIWRCLPDGSELESLSGGGFDNSIEIDFMPSGDPIGTMTYFRDPADGQRDALMHWVKGGVYPKPQAVIQEDQLKLTGDLMPVVTKMPRVAPAGIVRFQGDQWGEDYKGDWFSAIFNTGQVLQHHIRAEGGSYKSEDETFLSSDLPDFHPTDVLQDANGDMLVVITGGWFIKGCPLSKVAKPDVSGGIYRIKKKGNKGWSDPWGSKIAFDEKSVEELVNLLDDERPMVRKNAMSALIHHGQSAINSLKKRQQSDSEDVRLNALYALHQIGLEESKAAVRSGFEDSSESIRTAAARLSGLSKDQSATTSLMNLVENDPSLIVRRQAATALGQIGSAEAIPALLNASEGVNDRFLLHAIRYALITFNQPDKVIPGLDHQDESVRITALIALDQMDASPLTKEQVRPYLTSTDKTIQEAGIWVINHHPDWADVVTDYIKGKMAGSSLTDEEISELENLMVTFCGNEDIQVFIQQTLSKSSTQEKIRLALLNVMKRCTGSTPKAWIASLDQQLRSSTECVRSSALNVIESHQIKELESSLTGMLSSASDNPELYLKIINARLAGQPQISMDEFKHLTSLLDNNHSIPVRRSSIQVLDGADLTNDQMLELARTALPASDEITLPGIARLFMDDSTKTVGDLFVTSLLQKTNSMGGLSVEDLNTIFAGYPESVQQKAKPVIEALQQQNAERLDKLHTMEEGLVKGDVGRGRELFFGKAICSTCHAVGQEGNDFGPDLTNIGEIRSRHDLLESIEYPGVTFARQYETYVIKTDNQTYAGVLADDLSPEIVALKIAPGQTIRIPKGDILSMEPGTVSLMPPGLTSGLSNQEVSDLIAFMEALPYTFDRLLELTE